MMMPSIFGNNFVDDVFDDMFPFAGNYTTANYDLMKTDVKDAGDHYELEMEMPGVEKENIKAELKDGYLTVTAQQNTNKDEKDKQGNYIRRERYSGSCQRSRYCVNMAGRKNPEMRNCSPDCHFDFDVYYKKFINLMLKFI